MNYSNEEIYSCLHSILFAAQRDHDSYIRWCKGFRGEQEFKNKLNELGVQSLDGGWFKYWRRDSDHEWQTSYWTVSSHDESAYSDLYFAMSKLKEVDELFFLRFLGFEESKVPNLLFDPKKEGHYKEEIVCPRFECMIFNPADKSWTPATLDDIKKRSPTKPITRCAYKTDDEMHYLLDWPNDDLAMLYAERYAYDVLHADRSGSGMDIDHIAIFNGKPIIVEQKAKDPANKFKNKEIDEPATDPSKWKFGWDGRRVVWYLNLSKNSGLEVWYVIKELDNQRDRNEVGWKYVTLDGFSSQIEQGMGLGNTVLAPYLIFKNFDEVFGE